MKLFKIISKNYKVLIRSKSSALVVILGPLLLILLVGLAFSNSSSFTLNIGYFTPEKSDLTNSYIEKLDVENYRITEFYSEQECVDSIRNSRMHTCIIFPQDFELSNDKTNDIKFYIDQTKQNFVYAVVNTLSSSFGERSSELSLDLTTQIVNVITRTKNKVSRNKDKEVAQSIDLASDVLSTSKKMQNKLIDSKVDTEGVGGAFGTIDKESLVLRNRITSLYGVGNDILNLTETIYYDGTGYDVNNSYENQIENYLDNDGPLWEAWNETIDARNKLVNATYKVTSSISSLVSDIEDVELAQQEIVAELKNGLDVDMKTLKDNLEGVEDDLGDVLEDISAISVSDAENIVAPITTTIETVVPEKSQLDYLFPSLIVLLIMFISILLSSTLIIMEKNSRAFFRNYTTPTNDSVFILATYLTSIFLMIVQISVVILISGLIFRTSFIYSIHNILLLVFLISSIFVLVGMVIGYIFNTEQTSMIGAISVGSFILLTSDMILPIENMPQYIQNFAKFNPFIISSDALRKVILFSSGFKDIRLDIISLFVTSIFIAGLIFIIHQIVKSRLFDKFSRGKKSKIPERPESIKDIFKINNNVVKDDKELYRFIKRLPKKEFKKLVYKRTNRVADFVQEVLGDEPLAKKLSKMKTKWGVLKVIEKHRPKAITVDIGQGDKKEPQKKASKNIAKKKIDK